MKKRIGAVLAVYAVAVAALLAFSASALAGPHFSSATSSVNNDGALVVSFDESGLGNGDITYALTASARAEYACFNNGGKHPQAANKETVNSTVSIGGTFQAKNGRVRATLPPAGPPSAGDFSCPGGQHLVFVSVSYTNIVLTDVTNGVSTSVPDASS